VLPAVAAAEWSTFVEGGPLRHAARLLNPWAEVPSPPILQLTMQGVFLGTNNASVRIRREADLFIEPPVGKFWFLDFSAFDKIVDAGYRAAQRDIEAWLARDPQVARDEV
jgi:predicted acylesterase/phospholipase RssA